VIVGVGDITGDGKADLVSRDSAGNVWRNNGNGKGWFGARTRIATGWQGYQGLFLGIVFGSGSFPEQE
jgi:hypothetical protein